jgi:hypothetical protein
LIIADQVGKNFHSDIFESTRRLGGLVFQRGAGIGWEQGSASACESEDASKG